MSETNPGGADVAILVVDDSSFNRLVLKRRLAELGYPNVTMAEDGVQGLAALERGRFDIMLLDLEMPNLDGIGVLEQLRVARGAAPPVIVISALTDMDNIVRCIELGAEDYLPKSFDPPLLKARLGAVLEKKRLRDLADARLAALEAELESARAAQLSLVPRDFAAAATGELSVHAAMVPARQVGGDLYDCLALDGRHMLFAVADVSGKGAPAGLTMARTLGLMRAAAKRLAPGDAAPDPGDILTMTNDDLSADNESQTFVTVVLGVIDGTTGAGRIAVAGHDIPLLIAPGVAPRLMEKLRRQPALGVMEGIPYSSDPFQLTRGEAMFCYSDGVSEAEDDKGGFFGRDRLVAALADSGTDPSRVVDTVLRAVTTFADGAPQADDITALALRYAG
ncbi:PP2C family protein-serine/threonine phosphatase [Falsiroseomonas sp.]|uniref:PP2C family protein-serine/threonine phosphatase n=1 Tax=Falsiroseomonas sp. TaxID=2870721 RepID=UPI00271D4CD9|nr:SpoIIE family protein phosphatase [Falsiroseomonas sp.]MDO9498499.1 SpoIIE family protein phosphatase [Falsiroseomonas sp.]